MLQANKTLDVKTLMCPIPVIRTNQAIKDVGVGELLRIEATDPAFESDIKAWTRRTGNELIELQKEADVYVALVKRTK